MTSKKLATKKLEEVDQCEGYPIEGGKSLVASPGWVFDRQKRASCNVTMYVGPDAIPEVIASAMSDLALTNAQASYRRG
eukprot:406083-Amphidinium_carterae.1